MDEKVNENQLTYKRFFIDQARKKPLIENALLINPDLRKNFIASSFLGILSIEVVYCKLVQYFLLTLWSVDCKYEMFNAEKLIQILH